MKAFALVFLTACSAPFTMATADPPADDAGAVEAQATGDAVVLLDASPTPDATPDATPDTFKVEHDAGHPMPDAGPEPSPEPSPEPTPEAAPPDVYTCNPPPPYLSPAYCPASCGGCAGQPATSYIFRISASGSCGSVPTPAECQVCGSYTCACLLAHPPPGGCGQGVAFTCRESVGMMPTIVCS